jgi:predicted porin
LIFNLGVIGMKKSLITIAALAAATGALAQSSVTLYGRLDLGMSSNKNTSNSGAVGAPDATSKTFSLAGAQGVRTGGRLGVRGTEDLGGGLKASFNIETNVNPDNSVNSDGFGTFGKSRQGNLSLAGGFGTITIGTFDNAFDDVRGYSASTGGVAGGDFLFINTGAAIDARSQNSLGYRSPSFGGFYVRGNVLREKIDTTPALPGVRDGTYILAAGYDNGPLSALVAIGGGKNVVLPANTGGKVSDVGFGLSYDLGIAVPYFQFEQVKVSDIPAAGYDKVRAFEVGSKFPLGAFTPYITLSSGKISTEAGSTNKIRGFQIGTTYDISKRTYVYTAVGSDKKTGTNVAAGATASLTKNTGYALGLVHSF